MQGSQSDVLLVEDADDDAELFTRALMKRRPGTRVTVVNDGVEALRRLHGDDRGPAIQPRLIVLDLNLPRLDGLQILPGLAHACLVDPVDHLRHDDGRKQADDDDHDHDLDQGEAALDAAQMHIAHD